MRRAAGERPDVQRLRVLPVDPVADDPPLPHSANWRTASGPGSPRCAAFCLDGTDRESHEARAFLIRRCIAWRNRHAQNRRQREVVKL